ncbi:hypothetical protein BJX66DRAFT_331162 [Aspergillus keveii]|uniref:Zn(2)-C6 fungal-type domain-containing protein n=1 Tax=Aspergillus keveii TaxID=714993 RepID=A0ABR4FGW5_9EURO
MASRTTKASLRPLLPATASCSTPVQEPTRRNRKRHRQTTACTSCQAKRIKCSGSSPCDDRRRKEALKHAEQSKKALEAIIAILYNGTEVDLHELKTQVKSFASPEAVMEELLEHVFI